MRRVALVLCMAAVLAACGRADADHAAAAPRVAPRIASLSPALTAAVVALGWESALVGRTPWCRASAPIVGSLLEVDLETLARMDPTVILAQRTNAGVPPQLEEAARARGWRLVQIPANTLGDLRRLPQAVAKAVDAPPPVDPRKVEAVLDRELAACPAAAALSPAILLYGEDPIAAFAPETYLAQAWSAMGGSLAWSGGHQPNLSMEELFAMKPRAVIVVHAGDAEGAPPASPLRDACAAHGVELLDVRSPGLLRPGPELADGLRSLRAALEARAGGRAAGAAETRP
jgi:ABC-type hemin transport system substrate-binding protein